MFALHVGSALASDPTLVRKDFKMIAVMTLPLQPRTLAAADAKDVASKVVEPAQEKNPINPCGACNEWLKKIAEVLFCCVLMIVCKMSL